MVSQTTVGSKRRRRKKKVRQTPNYARSKCTSDKTLVLLHKLTKNYFYPTALSEEDQNLSLYLFWRVCKSKLQKFAH
jgi:hypothetical protein